MHINKFNPCYFKDIPEVEKNKTPLEEVDSSDEEKPDSENKPLIQYAPQVKETIVQKPVSQKQQDEVRKQTV